MGLGEELTPGSVVECVEDIIDKQFFVEGVVLQLFVKLDAIQLTSGSLFVVFGLPGGFERISTILQGG